MNEEPFIDSTEPTPETAKEAFKDLGNAAKRAFRAGKNQARNAAKEVAPRFRKEVHEGLHDISWAVGYIGAFVATLARSLPPEAAKSGFVEGADSGRTAAENLGKKKDPAPSNSVEIVVKGS